MGRMNLQIPATSATFYVPVAGKSFLLDATSAVEGDPGAELTLTFNAGAGGSTIGVITVAAGSVAGELDSIVWDAGYDKTSASYDIDATTPLEVVVAGNTNNVDISLLLDIDEFARTNA